MTPWPWRNLLAPAAIGLCLLTALSLSTHLLFLETRSYDYDEGVYWASLRSLSRGHALFTEVFSSQPPLFLLGLLPAYEAFGHTLVAARAMILVYSFVALLGIYWTARSIAGRRAGWIAVLLLATYPMFLRGSAALGAEIPAIAFELASLTFAVRAAKATGRRRLLLAALSGAALAVGILNKLPVVIGAIPVLAYLLRWAPEAGEGITRRSINNSLRAGTLATFIAGTAAVTLVTLAPFWERRLVLYQQVVEFHVAGESHRNGWLLGNLKVLLLTPSHAPLGLFGLACVVLLVRNRQWMAVPPLLWVLASFAFLLAHRPLFKHHLLLLAPALALIAALAVVLPTDTILRTSRLTRRRCLMAGAVIVIIVNVILSTKFAIYPPDKRSTADTEMIDSIRDVTKPGDYVVSDNQYLIMLAGRDVPPELVDTSHKRFNERSLTEPQLRLLIVHHRVRAVLFTGGRFDDHLRHTEFQPWIQAHFHLYRRFGHNRALYIR